MPDSSEFDDIRAAINTFTATQTGPVTAERNALRLALNAATESITAQAATIATQAATIQAQALQLDELDPAPPITAPPPIKGAKYATMGLAVLGSDPVRVKAVMDRDIPFQILRMYKNTTVPASVDAWPQLKAAFAAGLIPHISLALNPIKLANGEFDQDILSFIATFPPKPKVMMTICHEPSAGQKMTKPVFQAAWNHFAHLVKGKGVIRIPIDVQANIVPDPHRANTGYLDGLQEVDGIGLDAYDGIGDPSKATKSLAEVVARSLAHCQQQYPGVPIWFCEVGTSRASGRAAWYMETLVWAEAAKDVAGVYLFSSLGGWIYDDQEWDQLADQRDQA